MGPTTAALSIEPADSTEPIDACSLDDATASAVLQQLSIPPKASVHIKGYHNDRANVSHPVIDFDIWIDCLVELSTDTIQLKRSDSAGWSTAVRPPSDRINSVDRQDVWLKETLTTACIGTTIGSILVEKGINSCDLMAIKANARLCADVVKYAGSLDVEIHSVGLTSTVLPSGVTCAVGMPQIEPFVTVKQEWAVDWPLQGDPLAGRAAPFRLPSPANIMRLTVSNRTWLNRLQHAMVDGHHGYIKLSDEIADETSPRMKAVRSRSLRTAVCSQYELRDLSRRYTKTDTWGGDE